MSAAPGPAEISRVLSHALRHAPEQYGLTLDPEGWAPVSDVLAALHRKGRGWELIDEAALHQVIETANKKRHRISAGRIRAVHGHSVPVRPGYLPSTPPAELFHGTARSAVPRILALGLLPMRRQHVHLAETAEQARQVGSRRDPRPAVLTIDTRIALTEGLLFYRSESGVWLTSAVPPSAIAVPGPS